MIHDFSVGPIFKGKCRGGGLLEKPKKNKTEENQEKKACDIELF